MYPHGLFMRRGLRTSARRVVVALSGGVDSAVAAALCHQQERATTAIHMSNWNSGDDDSVDSCIEKEWIDAQAVAQHLRIDILRTSFESHYWHNVFDPFLQQVMGGDMGNPDINCNVHVKFGSLREFIGQRYGSDTLLATGHYARLWHRHVEVPPDFLNSSLEKAEWLQEWGKSYHPTMLIAAADTSKDQSYFLSGCTGKQLENALFPLGDYFKKKGTHQKTTVRELAQELKLPNAFKKESMGICFVGKRQRFGDFCSEYLPSPTRPVEFVDVDTGAILERTSQPAHAVLYTIGQGAKLGGHSEKYFVVDRQESQVLVCQGTHHPALYCSSLRLKQVSWTAGELPTPLRETGRLRLKCRIRHLQPLLDCEIQVQDDQSLVVSFDKALRGVTPGQVCVFYIGLVCLGGGPILERGPTFFEQGLELPTSLLHPAGQNDHSIKHSPVS